MANAMHKTGVVYSVCLFYMYTMSYIPRVLCNTAYIRKTCVVHEGAYMQHCVCIHVYTYHTSSLHTEPS